VPPQEYWRRAWCRVEAYLAAAVPVPDAQQRALCYRGGLRAGLEAGRRPHTIFGTKEMEEARPPIFLPPMVNATYERYAPAKGDLTSEADRTVVRMLTETARECASQFKTGYFGDVDTDGEPHGFGRMIFDDGGVYEGEWVHGLEHGRGTYLWTWGDKYDGEWCNGKKEGACIHTYADGGRFEGEMLNDVREGYGHFQYHFGDSYDGFYSNDLKDYGIWFFKSGEAKVCRFELHESGSRSVEKGHGAKWNADRSQAWPLLDGQPDGEEEISLEDAADRASELGLPAEAPPILAEEGRIHIMKSFSAKLSSSYRTSYRETD